MTSPATSIIRCDDGTEIPFAWIYPDAPDHEWARDRAHWPQPLTPMEVWLRGNGWAGVDRAWDEVGMEPLHTFHRCQIAGPFLYVRMSPAAPERMAELFSRYREMAQQYGNAAGFWQQYCQPRSERVCGELAGTSADVSLRSAA